MSNEAAERLHPVYPGGPTCQPNCPGEWSSYHDGYADGYENAENAERKATVERIRAAALAKRKSWGAEGLPASLESILDAEAAR